MNKKLIEVLNQAIDMTNNEICSNNEKIENYKSEIKRLNDENKNFKTYIKLIDSHSIMMNEKTVSQYRKEQKTLVVNVDDSFYDKKDIYAD